MAQRPLITRAVSGFFLDLEQAWRHAPWFVRIPGVVILCAGIAVGVGMVTFAVAHRQTTPTKSVQLQPLTPDRKNAMVAKIAQFVEIRTPSDAEFIEVSDPEQLPDQPFFAQCQTGDVVVTFPSDQQVVLFRPKTQKMIAITALANVRDIPAVLGGQEAWEAGSQTDGGEIMGDTVNTDSLSQPARSATPAPQASTAAKPAVIPIALLDGADKLEVLGEHERRITATAANLVVRKKGSAAGKYTETVVFDVTGRDPATAQQLADVVGGKVVTSLPPEEAIPASVEFVVVIGGGAPGEQ